MPKRCMFLIFLLPGVCCLNFLPFLPARTPAKIQMPSRCVSKSSEVGINRVKREGGNSHMVSFFFCACCRKQTVPLCSVVAFRLKLFDILHLYSIYSDDTLVPNAPNFSKPVKLLHSDKNWENCAKPLQIEYF